MTVFTTKYPKNERKGYKVIKTRKPTPTRPYIIKVASELFFEKGFSRTTSTELCERADISKGNLTFYFPTKEHILAILVKMMIDFQWQKMEELANEGHDSVSAYCLELTTMAAISEDLPEMRDFLKAAYTHTMTLDLIRESDIEKVGRVFAEYTDGWDNEKFAEVEGIISGIEYATLISTDHSASLSRRISGALDTILKMFDLPGELRREKIDRALSEDYFAIGREIYESFKDYVTKTNENALEEVLKYTKFKTVYRTLRE